MKVINLKSKIHKAVSIALISAGFIPVSHAAETNVNINNPTGTTIDGTNENAVTFNNGSFTVVNDGTISTTGATFLDGITASGANATITELTNSGSITSTTTGNFGLGVTIDNGATLGTLTNTGTITGTSGDDSGYGVFLTNGVTATAIINSGTISGVTTGDDFAHGILVDNSSTLTTLTNTGTISSTAADDNSAAVHVSSSSTITTLTNNGTISGTGNDNTGGVRLFSFATITTLTNNGTISANGDNAAHGVSNFTRSNLTTLTNNGTISGIANNNNGFGYFIDTIATGETLTNSGTIEGTAGNLRGYGILISDFGTLTTLTNSGTISGTAGTQFGAGILINDEGLITNLTNNGTITSTSSGIRAHGIRILDLSTLTTLTNSGTISGTAGTSEGKGVDVDLNSLLTTLTNDGTISGTAGTIRGVGVSVSDSSTLTTLTNTGTITGTAGTNDGVGVIVTDNSTLTTLTNSGTITGTATNNNGYGFFIDANNSSITTLFNSGTITGTATGDQGYGIFAENTTTITTLTNTGTITGTAATNAFDIRVDAASSLTNFNNLQSGLTYTGELPSNYSTIIRSLDNYGSVAFSNATGAAAPTVYTPFTGTTAAAVYIKEGTYSSVMTGMTDANLNDTVTGTLTGDGVNSVGNATWTLTENGTNVWDLSVVGNYAFIDRPNTQLAFNKIASNIGEVFQNMTAGGNFAHMMTYDCNTFGDNGCVSFGGRITNSGGNDHSGTLLLGKKFSDNFRLSGFVDQSIDHNSYTDIQVDGNVPLIGLTGVWNKNADNQGLQVKLGNTYQSNDTEITRAAVGVNNFSERAKGDTTVETQSYIAEASYQITDSITSHRPFVAVRYMQTEMDGYTETNAAAPITYQDMDEESYVAIAGVKTSKIITPEVTLNLGFGLETDLNHNDAQLQGRIVGLSAFNAAAISSDPENSTRQLASIGADFNLAGGHKIGVKGMYQELRYRKDDATTVHVSYTLPF
jgi:hypothetical protein